jgi:glycosyltransferase involved in cell wall biosynthesis
MMFVRESSGHHSLPCLAADSASPLLSIITVTRNCGTTIERTLASIRLVKTPAIQYIVIDGASTDSTLEIISRYGDIVDVLVSERDSGIYNAMNKGSELASGDYTLFLNGDDYLLPDGFSQAVALLGGHKPEVLSCRSKVVSAAGKSLGILKLSVWRLFFFNTVPHLATFVRTDLQKRYRFREQFKIAADYDLFLRLLLRRHQFSTTELITAMHYRGGFSDNIPLSIRECRQIRRENLGLVTYALTRALEAGNEFLKAVLLRGWRADGN